MQDYFKETGGGVRVTATPYITYELESKTWTHFKNILEEQLKEYPTTLLQDRKILEEPNSLSVNVTNCILLRKGEKEILHYFLKIAQRMSRIFSMSRLVFVWVISGLHQGRQATGIQGVPTVPEQGINRTYRGVVRVVKVRFHFSSQIDSKYNRAVVGGSGCSGIY